MVKVVTPQIEEQRRKDILDAALYCFLHFGYTKTSMDDVAKKARLSRPLLYLKFKNKEDILVHLFDHIMDGRPEKAELELESDLPKKDLLLRVCEIMLFEPWGRISGFPMSQEFFGSCSMCDPEKSEKFDKSKRKIFSKILGDKHVGEVFVMALEGQLEDLPSVNVLKKRVEVLIDKFGN